MFIYPFMLKLILGVFMRELQASICYQKSQQRKNIILNHLIKQRVDNISIL